MPEVDPLRSDDPPYLGVYRIVGKLSEGGKSTVYLGTGPEGEQVAVKLVHADLTGSERFLRKVEELRQVSAFCTAQVVETGLAGDRPYVVSEYIDGPTLRKAVEDDGPLRGAALYRLAIGTMTALVAIHQAGIVHRDFNPGSVLLGPDGPRVVDFGIAEALDASAASTTRSVGMPAYLTPEQLEGEPVGPAADLFAWGATMLFAASGRSPFEAGSMSGTINRVLGSDPDLTVLDDDLRGLVADCLAKDPRNRPAASDVLLRLVGHSQILAIAEPVPSVPAPSGPDLRSAPPPDPATRVRLPPPSQPGRRRRSVVLGAAAVAIALVSGGAVYALTPRAAPVPVAAPSPTPVPSPSSVVIEASPTPPPAATKEVKAPGARFTLHENPADPVRLVSYFITDNKGPVYSTYAREPGGEAFRLIAQNADFGDPTVSPDGKWVAVNPWLKFAASSYDYVTFINRATGEKFSVDTLKQPLRGLSGTWSPDSRRLLLTFYEFDVKQEVQYPAGFVVVDVGTRRATVVKTDDQRDGYGNFDWSPDGTLVVGAYEHKKPAFGLRFRDQSGKVVRTMPWVGLIPGPGIFSPSGTRFYTYCPENKGKLSAGCVWDVKTGNRTASVPIWDGDTAIVGWWDDHHLIVRDPRKDPYRYVVVDLHGKVVRALAEITKKNAKLVQFRFARK
ncbi:serine/threonine protein kinase [Streptosporangium roseum]|uniref:non-specific serine/threonine protein kinase n=1 Tax=Streptosporangium roseum (strain ATCC 12428 / DSM 43021 / JCM 3005 / KCTC 9067 / NCIMB 10171 / NRRL 2505 / NI 9100) TaxID=479432 RepID=D2BE71_STRRD|nr:serine/threonine-protein kinase [Streptosporangium roseum]ACZ90117.1 Serine/threonine protein kinase-like protein [Streptosporangium roseum DSM 43021]